MGMWVCVGVFALTQDVDPRPGHVAAVDEEGEVTVVRVVALLGQPSSERQVLETLHFFYQVNLTKSGLFK